MVAAQGHGSLGGSTNKITKARSKVVKPILKKLSYSEKGSLDLDRGWEDQQQQMDVWEPVGTGRSAKDVSFSFGTAGARGSSSGRSALALGVGGKEGPLGNTTSSTGSSGGGGGSGGGNVRKSFQQHGRSHSGNSVATNGSGGGMSGISGISGISGVRTGSFVHPFQQMPRTSTPPLSLSYANSLASFDNSNNSNAPREYSPTITENEDDGDSSLPPHHLHLNLNHHHSHHHHHHHSSFSSAHQPTLPAHSSTFSQTGLRRPSLASQRTSSLTDITSALTSTSTTTTPQLRVSTTGRSTPTASRLAPSKSDLHLNLTLSDLEQSPVGSSLAGTPTLVSSATAPAVILASPTSSSSVTNMSPLRTSLEAMGTRLRSRSEVDSAARQEHIRQARRKFEERERAKEAKYEREEVERRNRQANKEASRIEKETREWYKATGVSSSGVVACAGGVLGTSSVDGSSVNVNNVMNLSLSESVLQAPAACATRPGRPSASRRTTGASIATAASLPTHPMTMTSKSVAPGGVFGGKRKGSVGMSGTAAGSSSRPDVFAGGYSANNASSSRKNSGFGNERQANVSDAEKGIPGYARDYDTLPDGNYIPRFGRSIDDDTNPGAQGPGADWRRDRPRRTSTAKKKTQTYWQGFVLWLRTKIFRLSKR